MQMDSNTSDIPTSLDECVTDMTNFVGNDPKQREKLESWRQELRKRFNFEAYKQPGREWYQTAFIENFLFMYDKSFYDRSEKRYRIDELLDEGELNFGGYDFILLWQSYLRLGMDNRNQFDYYRDMPGGLEGLRKIVDRAHERGVRVFINYNPWDTGTRREGKSDAEALVEILQATNTDGIFLDTMFGADPEFRTTIEKAIPHVVFDPEGMPPPKAGEFLTGSWQQLGVVGIAAPPNMITIRWLEPRFSFRGIDRNADSRAPFVGVNFFNGAGHVVWENIFGWWNPWSGKDRAFLKKCVSLLREHKDAFLDPNWQPYVETLVEGIYAHQWSAGEKTVYTLLNTTDKKVEGPIIAVSDSEGRKYYDVWGDDDVKIKDENGMSILSFSMEPDSPGCLLVLPKDAPAPEVANIPDLPDTPYRRRVNLEALKPRPVLPTPPAKEGEEVPRMVFIPGGRFIMNVHHNVHPEGCCYGDVNNRKAKDHPTQYHWLSPYFIDKAEATNAEYKVFLAAAHYCPSDLTNFLKHWKHTAGHESEPWTWDYPEGKGNHPVVWVDLDDARAYAVWAGKRLPKEEEWQFSAQGPELRTWPWGSEFDPALCNSDSDDTTPVDEYPDGASPFGCLDMSGNVWEWTESERDDGHTRYAILRGGSYIVVQGSNYYRASGAQPCDVHEKMLLMYPGLDRCVNIGFRCLAVKQ